MANINRLTGLVVVLPLALLLIVPLTLAQFDYPFSQTMLATLLIEVSLYPTFRYFSRRESGLPAMPIFSLAYALQFAVPIFIHDATIELSGHDITDLKNGDVVAALIMSLVGLCALQGAYFLFKRSRFRHSIPCIDLHLNKSRAILYCVIVGLLLPVLFNFRNIIPDEYQQPLSAILRLLQNQSLVAISVLAWLVYGLGVSRWYAAWLYVLVGVMALRGISTGTIEEALVPIGVLFAVRWVYSKRISFGLIAAAFALVLLLSPVKSEYREQIWYGDALEVNEMSASAKVGFWLQQASDYWIDTLHGKHTLAEATSSAAGRSDFIHQVAHIYSMTPKVVPYQYGETYSYFAVALIPRIIWPNKPQAGNANGFFAVTYGLTDEEGAKLTTFGVSILGEAFINFGWVGVVLMMAFQGFLISLLQQVFGRAASGPGGQAVFIAFFIFFLNGIGSSAEILFGNLAQNLLCGCVLLLWARNRPTSSKFNLASTSLAGSETRLLKT